MLKFSDYTNGIDLLNTFIDTDILDEAVIVDPEKLEKTKSAMSSVNNEIANQAHQTLNSILKNGYGRSTEEKGVNLDFHHIHDDNELHREREQILAHVRGLLESGDKKKIAEYKKIAADAKARLKMKPFDTNRKTKTMLNQKVNGSSVFDSISNKGAAASTIYFQKGGKRVKRSTCVGSKESCRGFGPDNVGAPCLGKIGSCCGRIPRISNMVLENLFKLKAPHRDGLRYGDSSSPVVSPHLDYAIAQYDHLIKSLEKTKNQSEITNKHHVTVFRQNTQNEHSSMHYDQLYHNIPNHLKGYLATNNYSTIPAKSHYDPNNPSDAPTHDGIFHNVNMSYKGPHVIHDNKGNVLGINRSSNTKDAERALNPIEYIDPNSGKKKLSHPQNVYAVVGGEINGQKLRLPRRSKGKYISFNEKNKPDLFTPFERLGKIKTTRVYGKEINLKEGEDPNFHHKDGWGHATFYDPHQKRNRTFEYQDYHTHPNVPKADKNGIVNFGTLHDNVGADDRKPKGDEVRRNRRGHIVGSFHFSAPTSATPNEATESTVSTEKDGSLKSNKSGVVIDPFVLPIQHHLDDKDETLFHLNHPTARFDAEEAERKKTPFIVLQGKRTKKEEHPKTKEEEGNLK